jgi:hypothetical protein
MSGPTRRRARSWGDIAGSVHQLTAGGKVLGVAAELDKKENKRIKQVNH